MTLERAAYILAMRILQSPLYAQCSDEERLAVAVATGQPQDAGPATSRIVNPVEGSGSRKW